MKFWREACDSSVWNGCVRPGDKLGTLGQVVPADLDLPMAPGIVGSRCDYTGVSEGVKTYGTVDLVYLLECFFGHALSLTEVTDCKQEEVAIYQARVLTYLFPNIDRAGKYIMLRIIPCLRGSYQPARQTRDVDPNYVVLLQ